MIFGKALIGKVLSGEKTVTRRRLTHRDGRPVRYKYGEVYAVQPGRGKKHVGHIRIVGIGGYSLGWISQEGAKEEGFRTIGAFKDYWVGLHGEWNPDERVAVIWFELEERLRCCAELEA